MGLKEKIPLINNEIKGVRIVGYIVYAIVVLTIIGSLLGPTSDNAPTSATSQGSPTFDSEYGKVQLNTPFSARIVPNGNNSCWFLRTTGDEERDREYGVGLWLFPEIKFDSNITQWVDVDPETAKFIEDTLTNDGHHLIVYVDDLGYAGHLDFVEDRGLLVEIFAKKKVYGATNFVDICKSFRFVEKIPEPIKTSSLHSYSIEVNSNGYWSGSCGGSNRTSTGGYIDMTEDFKPGTYFGNKTIAIGGHPYQVTGAFGLKGDNAKSTTKLEIKLIQDGKIISEEHTSEQEDMILMNIEGDKVESQIIHMPVPDV